MQSNIVKRQTTLSKNVVPPKTATDPQPARSRYFFFFPVMRRAGTSTGLLQTIVLSFAVEYRHLNSRRSNFRQIKRCDVRSISCVGHTANEPLLSFVYVRVSTKRVTNNCYRFQNLDSTRFSVLFGFYFSQLLSIITICRSRIVSIVVTLSRRNSTS